MNKEKQMQHQLLTESLKLTAQNEKEYREMERKYMRDFSLILEIDQPQQMVEYDTFVQMVRSKIQRLNTTQPYPDSMFRVEPQPCSKSLDIT